MKSASGEECKARMVRARPGEPNSNIRFGFVGAKCLLAVLKADTDSPAGYRQSCFILHGAVGTGYSGDSIRPRMCNTRVVGWTTRL